MADTLTAANVEVYGTGAVYRAPAGTALPTSADDAIDPAFEGHGYITQDGVSESINKNIQRIYAWQNNDHVRSITTTHELIYSFGMLELTATTLTTRYGVGDGTNVTDNGGDQITAEVRGGEGVRGSWILDFFDGDKRHVRIVIEDGQVTDVGDVARNAQGAAEMPTTVECYPATNGVKANIYTDATPGSS